jgi:hypothetical protein
METRYVEALCGQAGGNRSKAAKIAGYKSSASATQIHWRPRVQWAIKRYYSERIMSPEEWAFRVSAIVRTGLDSFGKIEKDGSFTLDLRQAEKAGLLWMVQELIPTEDGYRVKLPSKLEALALLGKHLGTLVDPLTRERPDAEPVEVRRDALLSKLEALVSEVENSPPSGASKSPIVDTSARALPAPDTTDDAD